MERNVSAIKSYEDNYYYRKGYTEGYKEGLRKALEQIPNIIAMRTNPRIIVTTEENYERVKNSLNIKEE